MKLLFLLALHAYAGDSTRADALFERYVKYQYTHQDSALFFIEAAIVAAEDMGQQKQLGELFREKGIFLKDHGRFKESVETLEKAIGIFAAIPDERLQAATYNNLGVTHWRSGDSEKALSYYFKSREMNLRLNNKPGLVRNYIAIGNYFASDHQYREAIENYDEARRLAGTEDKAMYALVLKNTGNIYNDSEFKDHDAGKALDYYQQSIAAYEALGDTVGSSGLYVNLGLVYENQNELDKAERQYVRAIAMQSRLGLTADVVGTYLNLGNVYAKKSEWLKAKESFLAGIVLAKTEGNSNAYRNLARRLSECFHAEKNYPDAYHYFLLYDSLDQIIYSDQKTAIIKELEAKYETEKKQAEISLRTQQRDSMMITLIVALVLTILVVWIYSQRQKMIVQLRERDKALMNNKIDELLRKQEIRSLRAYLNGQDEERKRLSEDLHDRLGSTLSATKLYCCAMTEADSRNQQALEKVNQLLDNAVTEVREISHNLLSGSIAKFGLKTALHELSDTISQTNQLKMNVLVHGLDTRLDPKIEHQLYRIVQELVSNVLKHAAATELTLQVNRDHRELALMVEDNGVGFKPESEISLGGIGLGNVASRIQSLDGNLRIDSGKGSGTTILITIPLATL